MSEQESKKPTAAELGQQPAVPVEESVQEDYLVCLEDGKRLLMLKRYLSVQFGMTPDEYRAKWGLPDDYPMNAPSYVVGKRNEGRAMMEAKRRGASAQPRPAAPNTPPPVSKPAAPKTAVRQPRQIVMMCLPPDDDED